MLSKLLKPKSKHVHPQCIQSVFFSISKSYTQPFRILDGHIQKQSAEFKTNYQQSLHQIEHLHQLNHKIQQGGSEKSIQKLIDKGKLMVRDRIANLLDQDTYFFELSTLAGYQLYTEKDRVGKDTDIWLPAGGIVCGIGQIHRQHCMIVANDSTVKGGTYFPITVTKHLRAQEIAQKCHLPCLYIVDSGGAFLPKQADVFPSKQHFGAIFYNQAIMSSLKIPQISLVLGSCTAGGAYIPAMSDENVIVRKQGTIFLGGPPLVQAATGEKVTDEELGGGDVHCFISGVSDHYAEDEHHALEIGRNIVSNLNITQPSILQQQLDSAFASSVEEPKYDIDDVLGLIPANKRTQMDMRQVIARIVDGSRLDEFKRYFGASLITGFAKVGGVNVGVIANNGVLYSDSAQKGAHFIELCCQRQIPLLFFQDISGFMVGKEHEHAGISKHGAKMVTAVSCAKVPKITVIMNGSFGAGNYGMCGRAFDPNFVFMWPNARISVMAGESAATVLRIVKENQSGVKMNEEEKRAFEEPILRQYENEGHPYYSSARLWDDGVIDPRETRNVLRVCLNASLNAPMVESKFGVFRM